ncbi:hypothetical protein [Enterococcus faecium]|nr:hypothetical protein [Enterococcus faecium]
MKHDAWVQKDDYQKKYIDAKKVAEFNGNESAVQMILEDLAKNDTK